MVYKRKTIKRKRAPARMTKYKKPRRAIKNKLYKVPTGFPSSKLLRMRYVENYSLGSTLGVMQTYSFRCNSIYDPNFSGVGHSALGHDQFAQFYNKYVVLGAKITISGQGYGNANASSMPVYTGIKRDLDNSVATDYNLLKEQGVYSKLWNPLGDSHLKLNGFYSAKKNFSLTNVRDNVDRVGSLFNDNPQEQMYFVHFLQSQDRATTAFTAFFTASIDYIVLCSEYKDLPMS